jgi:L-alanine-DL-glutamate epimerase-like enolase superfamily enzyme
VKITHIEPMLIALPYDHGAPKPTLSTGATRTLMDAVYIRVDTDEGITGWGEAFGFGSCPITLEAARIMVAPLAVGRDPTDVAALMGELHRRLQSMALNGPVRYALSGLDIALWDIAGKIAGQPIHRLLGGDGTRTRLPVYASLLRMQNPVHVAKVSTEAASRGYRHIKLHERTIEEVAAARDAVGPDTELMLDTNCHWSLDQAIHMARGLQKFDLTWLEEPVYPADAFDALARIRRDGGIPVAAGENLGTLNDLRRLVGAGAVDFVQPDVTKFGGITEMWKAVEFTAGQTVAFEPHSPLYGPGLVATQHIVAAMKADAMCEFYFCDLGASPMGDAILPADGFMAVPQGPGLGVDVDEQVIEKYRVS